MNENTRYRQYDGTGRGVSGNVSSRTSSISAVRRPSGRATSSAGGRPAAAPSDERRGSPIPPAVLVIALVCVIGVLALVFARKSGGSAPSADNAPAAQTLSEPLSAQGIVPTLQTTAETSGGNPAGVPAENPAGDEGFSFRPAEENPAFKAWMSNWTGDPDARSFVGTPRGKDVKYGYVPPIRDKSYLMRLNAAGPSKALGEDVPPQAKLRKFDLRAENRVTPVKDQNPYGTCWAHAAIASAESALMAKTGKTVDLSENALVNGHGWFTTGWFGAFSDTAQSYFLGWRGAFTEVQDPYAHPSSVANGRTAYHLQEIRWIPGMRDAADTATIKAALVSHGGLWVAYHADDDGPSAANGYYYTPCCLSDGMTTFPRRTSERRPPETARGS